MKQVTNKKTTTAHNLVAACNCYDSNRPTHYFHTEIEDNLCTRCGHYAVWIEASKARHFVKKILYPRCSNVETVRDKWKAKLLAGYKKHGPFLEKVAGDLGITKKSLNNTIYKYDLVELKPMFSSANKMKMYIYEGTKKFGPRQNKIAAEYSVSTRTIRNHLKKLGIWKYYGKADYHKDFVLSIIKPILTGSKEIV